MNRPGAIARNPNRQLRKSRSRIFRLPLNSVSGKRTRGLLHACHFKHIHREANQVAHLLVQKTLENMECVSHAI
jgi:hypothetical protein